MECICVLENEYLMKEWGTPHPETVVKKELPSIKEALSQPMFTKMKVTVEPIAW